MSATTTTQKPVIPEEVTQAYLKKYSTRELARIEDIYRTISLEAFKEASANQQGTACKVMMVVGAQGSGKSMLARRLAGNNFTSFVNADVDRILKSIPAVADDLHAIAQQAQDASEFGGYDLSKHFNEADTAIKKWRPAAEYMRDRLMMDALKKGYNVILQVSGKSAGTAKLIEALDEAGHAVETHICVSPLSVAMKGARSPQHGFAYPEAIIRADHEAMRENIPAIVEAGKKEAMLYYRGAENSVADLVFKVTKEAGFVATAMEAVYDAHVADVPYRIQTHHIAARLGFYRQKPLNPSLAPEIK